MRYASAVQVYLAQLRNSTGVFVGLVDFNHWIRGVGPTLSLGATQFVTGETNLFVRGRGSVLFGNHKWHLDGGELLTPTTPVFTNQDGRDGETLSIVEVQAGVSWQAGMLSASRGNPSPQLPSKASFGADQAMQRIPDGDLSFLGFTMGVGCHW